MKKKSKLFKDMSLMTESDLVEFKKNPIRVKQTLHNTDHDKFKDFSVAKQQQGYSEEEVLDLIKARQISLMMSISGIETQLWFEQFKKK